jgi:hypothetical protein
MTLFRMSHWLHKWQGQRRAQPMRSRARRPYRLTGEGLEERVLLDTARWINPASGDWGLASN